MSFVVELWQSVFEPGTNPALVKATHGSFIALTLTLSWMIYTSGSIHFVNLLVISLLLWASVIWFMSELQKEKLKSNEELFAEADEVEKEKAEKEKAKKSTTKTLEEKPKTKTVESTKTAEPVKTAEPTTSKTTLKSKPTASASGAQLHE